MGNFMRSIKVSMAVSMAFVLVGVNGVDAYAGAKSEKVSISLVGKYDSSDTASIRSVDTENKEIRFRNHATGRTYTLKYDNTSMMYDLRGTPMSARLLEEGQIVDVNFLKSSKHVTSLKVSDEAWTIDDTRNHELVRGDGTARIQGETYKLDSRTLILADGSPAIAEDILTTDNIKAYGIGKEVYSVVVTSGHGYVSLSSDTVDDHSLVGAWLELDNDVIYKISPNMLLSAPEGDYNLQIIGNGAEYKSTVNISRNQETVVDTRNVKITKPKEGLVSFEVTPEDAEIYLDGEQVLTGTSKSVSYGYHNLKVSAEGYITQNKYLKVGSAKSVIKIELEPESDDTDSSRSSMSDSSSFASSKDKTKSSSSVSVATLPGKSSSATSASSVTDKDKTKNQKNKVIEGYKVYVDEPAGVELFFDGNYIGITPTNFKKVSGSHEIILRKSGYNTKSYRVNIDVDEVDVNYRFDDMVKEHKDDEPKPTIEEKPGTAATASTEPTTSTTPAADTGKSSTQDTTKKPDPDVKDIPSSDATAHYTKEPSAEASSHTTATTEDSSTTASTEDDDKKNKNNKDNKNSKDIKDKKENIDAANTASGEE